MDHIAWIALVFIFSINSLLSFVLNKSVVERKIHIRILFICLLIYAICYSPSKQADIYRFVEGIKYMKLYGADAAFERTWYVYENSIVFFYIMRGLSIFPTFLFYPICVTVTYGIPLYLFYDTAKNDYIHPNEYSIAAVFFICCINFGIVTSIVRYFFAYMIGTLGIYLWFTKKTNIVQKLIIICLIVVPLSIHTSGFYLVCVWIISLLCKFRAVKKLSVLLVGVTAFSEEIIKFTGKLFGENALYNFIIKKYESYSLHDYESTFSRSGLVYIFICLVILGIIIWAKHNKTEELENERFNNMYFIFLIMTIAMVANSTVFYRIVQIVIALTPIYFIRNRLIVKMRPWVSAFLLFVSFCVLIYYGRFTTYYYL